MGMYIEGLIDMRLPRTTSLKSFTGAPQAAGGLSCAVISSSMMNLAAAAAVASIKAKGDIP